MAVAMVAMVVGRRSIRVLSSVSVESGIVVGSCGRISGKVRSDVSIVFLFCFSIALHCIAWAWASVFYLSLGGFVVLSAQRFLFV